MQYFQQSLMGEHVQPCSAIACGCSLGKLLHSVQFLNNTGQGDPFFLEFSLWNK